MPDAIRFEVKGLRELGLAFQGLDDAVQRKVAGQATGAAARVVKAADKQNLQRSPSIDTGLVEKNVIIKKLGKRQAGDLTAAHIVTEKKTPYPSDNAKGSRNTRRSAGYLEFGTVKMPAEPHLRPALQNNVSQAINAMKDKLAKGIAAQARKGNK